MRLQFARNCLHVWCTRYFKAGGTCQTPPNKTCRDHSCLGDHETGGCAMGFNGWRMHAYYALHHHTMIGKPLPHEHTATTLTSTSMSARPCSATEAWCRRPRQWKECNGCRQENDAIPTQLLLLTFQQPCSCQLDTQASTSRHEPNSHHQAKTRKNKIQNESITAT